MPTYDDWGNPIYSSAELAEIAENAVEVLDEKGHTRLDYENKRGVCAIGAIRIAACGDTRPHGRFAESQITQAAGLSGYLIDFNDEPYITKNGKRRFHDKRDVQRLLKRAARELRKQAAADGSAVSTA
jgi:hypothetical protein